ncbi:unnamed protein product [Lactuca virosa]|uniref:Uncharacterized protein n=1 Tax=Lactuca virosa TaxID=75947 RepID=A0AAU9M0F4_9ASTR|nr:unnamed protein product [Lactuca virosa]
MGHFIRREDDEHEDVSSDTDMELETVEREFADEEAYCAIFDIGYIKTVTEKGSMEKTLTGGLKKFPDSKILIEMMTLMRMLFNDGASNENAIENESDGIDEDTNTDENMLQKNAQHEIFGQASGSNKSPVTPSGIKENV